ncbi:FecR family protein [Sphingobacterium spiritivorum]|uniref:FecR family protein n=1 Tax=Sphingobacterium spiritivorum TaxID=258 RepID=UPI003DA29D79
MISEDKILLAELAAELVKGNELTITQEALLQELLAKYPDAKSIIEKVVQDGFLEVPYEVHSVDVEKELEKFRTNNSAFYKSKKQTISFKVITWIISTAAILLIGFFLFQKHSNKDYIVEDKVYGQKNDILPGTSGAILEIEGSESILLNGIKTGLNLQNGLIANSKSLSYSSIDKSNNPLHTLTIPIRSTYEVVLSDGTKAWVNADSKLKYLANFSKTERRVILEGQAYFAVAKDANRPFIVESNGVSVQAVGTEFDVDSYSKDLFVKLVEGKVKVSEKTKELQLEAGEQVEYKKQTFIRSKIENIEEATAWKNGYFYFDNKDLNQILAEIMRWYGVTIKYEKKINKTRYFGGISMQSSLAEVCNVLKDLTNHNFKIEENILIIE